MYRKRVSRFVFLLSLILALGGCGDDVTKVTNITTDSGWESSYFNPRGEAEDGSQVSAINTSGDAIIAWSQYDGNDDRIYVSTKTSGVWTHPSSITDAISPDTFDANDPEVAIDDSGNIVVVWRGDSSDILVADYGLTVAGQWTLPADESEILNDTASNCFDLDVAIDGGKVLVTWQQSNGLDNAIFVADYGVTTADTWTKPTDQNDFVSFAGSNAQDPDVVIMGGKAFLVWLQFDDVASYQKAFYADYGVTTAATWTFPADIDSNFSLASRVDDVQIAMTNDGAVIAVEQQDPDSYNQVYVWDYNLTTADTLTAPADLTDFVSLDVTNSINDLTIAMSGDKVAVAWVQDPDIDDSDRAVFLADYNVTSAGVWTKPTTTDNLSPTATSAWDPSVGVSASGDISIAWTQYDSTDDIYQAFQAEYRDGVWDLPANVNDYISYLGVSEDDVYPTVVMSPSGDALTVWGENGYELYYDTGYYQLFLLETD